MLLFAWSRRGYTTTHVAPSALKHGHISASNWPKHTLERTGCHTHTLSNPGLTGSTRQRRRKGSTPAGAWDPVRCLMHRSEISSPPRMTASPAFLAEDGTKETSERPWKRKEGGMQLCLQSGLPVTQIYLIGMFSSPLPSKHLCIRRLTDGWYNRLRNGVPLHPYDRSRFYGAWDGIREKGYVDYLTYPEEIDRNLRDNGVA